MKKEKNFIKTRGALLRKYGAIEMATGDSFIKATLDSSKEYIDVKDAPELSNYLVMSLDRTILLYLE